MRKFTYSFLVAATLAGLASPALAGNCGNDKDVGNAQGCDRGNSPTSVPEPGSLAILAAGSLALAVAATRLRAKPQKSK